VDAITRGDVEDLLNAVKAGRTAAGKPAKRPPGTLARGGAGAAAQCVALAACILEFAGRTGADNPARGVKKPKPHPMQRFLSYSELGRLAESLDAEIERTNAVHAVAAIRLLALTGCRRGEITELPWNEVDFERRLLNLPD